MFLQCERDAHLCGRECENKGLSKKHDSISRQLAAMEKKEVVPRCHGARPCRGEDSWGGSFILNFS